MKPYAPIAAISEDIRALRVSPVEITEACLKRIEALNPSLNAFITVLRDEALEQAKIAEAEIRTGHWRGPLHGIPIGIKDFYDTAGIKTTAAFKHFKNRVPTKDAIAVAKLKEAGAIIIGKTNMHTLGMGTTGLVSYFGAVLNPWNPDYIPGGSSSGSAAAVASGMCYATLDTDAIGSCRLPSSCCGVVGFKGTYGLIDTHGILEGEEPPDPFITWMAHAAITTRSAEDTRLMLNVLAERTEEHASPMRSGKNIRIGIADNFTTDPDVSIAFETAVATLRELGYSMQSVIVPFDILHNGIEHIETDRKMVSEQIFKDVDVVVLPTIATLVPRIKDAGSDPQALSPDHTAFANYYGLPAISVPCGFDANGLPVGLQIVARPWDERTVLDLAEQYQRATPWSALHPVSTQGNARRANSLSGSLKETMLWNNKRMNKNFFKSVGAVLAGIVTIVVLSTVTDTVLEKTGIFTPPSEGFFVLWMILVAIAYRSAFAVAGGYVAALLAPNRPVRHAVILGIVGTAMGGLAAVATIPMNLAPAWFPIVLALLSLPSTWLGGKIYTARSNKG